MAKQFILFEAMSEHCTQRTCVECLKEPGVSAERSRATQWRFRLDGRGGVDRSSKQPVCTHHGDSELVNEFVAAA